MGERISTQARAVLDVLAASECHLTAEEICSQLSGIGTATVYRALDTLTGLGMIRRLDLGKKSAVYEYARQPHIHLVCRGCGGVVDVPADLSGMVKEAVRYSGHRAETVEITAHGLCRSCCEAEKETATK